MSSTLKYQNHSMIKKIQKTNLEDIDNSIKRANFCVLTWMLGSLAVYGVWFGLFNDNLLSKAPSDWGVLGDFVGGVLNPVVAYAAFYWLTKSIRLQKEELAETRGALIDAAEAQQKQVAYAKTTVRLHALSTLTNSIMVEVETQRMQIQFLINQLNINQSG